MHYPAGGLSILFAILSKGRETQNAGDLQSRHHHFGNRDLPVFPHHGAAFYLVFSNPDYRQQLNDMSQQMYGETFDDMLKERGLDL